MMLCSRSKARQGGSASQFMAVPRHVLFMLAAACFSLAALQIWSVMLGPRTAPHRWPYSPPSRATSTTAQHQPHSVSSLRALHHSPRAPRSMGNASLGEDSDDEPDGQCHFYLAESAIPQGGLGVFVGSRGLLKGDMIAIPDICIYVADMDYEKVHDWMHMRTHTWGRGNFFGQFEGRHNRAACEGAVTILNTMPYHMVNTKIISLPMPTNAGLHRATHSGAGAVTHQFGIHALARDVISAGSELTVYYGDFPFDPDKVYEKPQRDPEWLAEHGWCMDHIEVRPATDPSMGRGAFAKRALRAGSVVAPAPLQLFRDRAVFQDAVPEQLFVNYCLQPRQSRMVLYPYGQGVNLINHSRERPNVSLRWSRKSAHWEWLDLPVEELFAVAKPGGLVLEVVALRDLAAGEELFLDYGAEWDAAWQRHRQQWRPVSGAASYVYPADMDEAAPLRTVEEQTLEPYAANLMTMCVVPDRETPTDGKGYEYTWKDPSQYDWWQSLVFCHILDREIGASGEYVYTVSTLPSYRASRSTDVGLDYDETIPRERLFIENSVPRRAIRFVEKPYMDDEHLFTAFRHPIMLPDELTPEPWKTNVS